MKFQTGDLVFYDRVGVCRVEAVGKPDIRGLPDDAEYYTLAPRYGTETVLIPVNSKAYLRRTLTREEADALLDGMPELEPVESAGLDVKAVTALYQLPEPVASARALARLAIGGYRRGKQRAAQGRRPASVDVRQRRFAESLLHGELAAVLCVELDEIPTLIDRRFTS